MVRDRLRTSPASAAFLVAVVLLSLVAIRLSVADGDPGRFVLARADSVDQEAVPVVLATEGTGYDGLFFYRLALSPLTSEQTAFGITLDIPSYRHQRVLYPSLVWLFSGFGQPEAALWALIFVNVAALVGVSWIFAALAVQFGLPAIWGMLPALYNGLLISLGRDLAEPVSALCLAIALYAIVGRSSSRGALVLGVGVFARETILVTAAGGLVARLHARSGGWIWFALPFVLYAAWVSVLEGVWGAFPWEMGTQNFGPPIVGWGAQIGKDLSTLFRFSGLGELVPAFFRLIYVIWLAWFCALALPSVIRLIRSGVETAGIPVVTIRFLSIAWLTWLGLSLMFSQFICEDERSFVRVLTDWVLIGWVLLFVSGRLPGRSFLGFTAILFVIECVRVGFRP